MAVGQIDIEAMLAGEKIGPVVREWVRVLSESPEGVPMRELPMGDLAPGTVKNLRHDLRKFGLLHVWSTSGKRAGPWMVQLTPLGARWVAEEGLWVNAT